MKRFLGIAVIAGALLLCGVGIAPCLADAGTGIGVSAEATIVAGETGGGGGGSGGHRHHHSTTTSNNTSTELTDTGNATAYVYEPTDDGDDYVPFVGDELPPYIPIEGQPLPIQQSSIDWGKTILIIGAIGVACFVIWKFILKRKQG